MATKAPESKHYFQWQYDECFQHWLSGEYLNNNKKFPENFVPCEKFAAPYQACVQAHLDNEGIKLRYHLVHRKMTNIFSSKSLSKFSTSTMYQKFKYLNTSKISPKFSPRVCKLGRVVRMVVDSIQ